MGMEEHFNKGETLIKGDNIHKSKERYDAIERVKRNQGTAADHELVRETDRMMAEVVKQRRR